MKIILTASALLFASIAYSQIEVKLAPKETKIGKVKTAGRFHSELSYTVDESDTTYRILYNNAEYQTITDIQSVSFDSDDDALNKLYSVFRSFFLDENKKNKDYKVSLKLGESNIVLSNFRSMGITTVLVSAPIGYFLITEKQIDKLFGK